MLTQLRYLGTQNGVSVTAHVATFPPQLNSHRHGLVSGVRIVLVKKDISAVRIFFLFLSFVGPPFLCTLAHAVFWTSACSMDTTCL